MVADVSGKEKHLALSYRSLERAHRREAQRQWQLANEAEQRAKGFEARLKALKEPETA